MSEPSDRAGMHLALLINHEEWTARSLESILRPQGYAVVMAYTGRQGYDLASRVDADLVLIDFQLPDIDGVDLCSRLRSLPTVRPSVPVVLFTSSQITRSQRLAAYRCGAWDVLQPPFDPQELVARMEPYVKAKRDADVALAGADIDAQTGCYNSRGLMRRLKEIRAESRRSQRPLACVVIGPSAVNGSAPETGTSRSEYTRQLGEALLAVTRESDAVARMADTDFVVLAPGTDRDGADRLIERVLEMMEGKNPTGIPLQAGVCAVAGGEPDSPAAEEFLRRATTALRDAQTRGSWDGWNRIHSYDRN